MNHKKLIAAGAATLAFVCATPAAARNGACGFRIPAVSPASGGGIHVAHVWGRCSFEWRASEAVMFHGGEYNKWIFGGVRRFGPWQPDTWMRQPAWSDHSYHGDGYWQLRVTARGASGQRVVAYGPKTEFSA